MDIKEAKEVILANTCCDISYCSGCPYDYDREKCENTSFTRSYVKQAIDTVRKMENI